ncbi:MAG TPA: VCBS repeat-containing protein [Thermoanaerobaculia bacterium]|jgi:hypothetical protein
MNNVIRAVFATASLLLCHGSSAANLFREPLTIHGLGLLGERWQRAISGDFTGDGRPDLAGHTGSNPSNAIIIIPAAAGGTFGPAISTPVPHIIHAATGDIDGDGKLDLVGAGVFRIMAFLGNGDGTFRQGGVVEDTKIDPEQVAVGDFTGDGKVDAAVITWTWSSAGLMLFPGDGAGRFGAAVTTPLPSPYGVNGLHAGDVNGDGVDDIVTGGGGHFVLLGGRSGLTWITTVPARSGPLALGDLNDDGILDAAVIEQIGGESTTLRLLTGNGDGSFTSASEHSVATGTDVAIEDTTGDGRPDVLVLGPVISILRARGPGIFDPPSFSRGYSGRFATADFDTDGRCDVIAFAQPTTRFMKSNGDGMVGPPDRAWRTHPRVFPQLPRPGLAMDMSGDGVPDLITTATEGDVASLSVLLNDRTGGMSQPVLTPIGGELGSFAAGFLDAGTRPDVVVLSGTSARSFLGSSDGSFTPGPVTPIATDEETVTVTLADVTGDGKADLLLGSTFYPGIGNGAFGAARSSGLDIRVTGDLNGDGIADAVGWDSSGSIKVAINDGTGAFTATLLPPARAFPERVADFNGDGKADIFATARNEVYVYRGRGDGTFDQPVVTWVDSMSIDAGPTADLDGDGHLDIVAGSTLLLGHGDGRFHDMYKIDFAGYPAVGDFDGNGKPDVAMFGAGVVWITFNGLAPEPSLTTSTTLTSNLSSSRYAQEVGFASRTVGGGAPVEGTVVLSAGGVPFALLGSVFRVDGAHARVSRATPVGSYAVSATYTGNFMYRPSTATVQHSVQRATTALTIAPITPVSFTGKIQLSTTVTRARLSYLPGPANPIPVIRSGGKVLAAEWLDGRVAVISTLAAGLNSGTHTLELELAGDDNYEPATASAAVTIHKVDSTIEYTHPPQVPQPGPVAFDVEVRSHAPNGPSTGAVRVSVNGNPATSVKLVDQHARFSLPLNAGSHIVTFAYDGDRNHHPVSRSVVVPVAAPWGTPQAVSTWYDGNNLYIHWTPLNGATRYRLYVRTSFSGPWTTLETSLSWFHHFVDYPETAMYAVAARNAAGTWTPVSEPKLFTSALFTDDPVLARVTAIKTEHVVQLRAAVNAVRAFAGLTPVVFAEQPVVRAAHIAELRTALSQARSAIGMPVTFTDPALTARTSVIRAVHLQELRNGTR